MKPVSRKVMPTTRWLTGDLITNFGQHQTIAKIKGSVRELGRAYQDAKVVLYNKATLMPLASRRPDENGNYQFLGLNTDLQVFIIGFDNQHQFNAVIQDNVVPE